LLSFSSEPFAFLSPIYKTERLGYIKQGVGG